MFTQTLVRNYLLVVEDDTDKRNGPLRAEIDTLTVEVVALKAEVTDLKSELAALKAGLDDRIQAAILHAQSEFTKSQLEEIPTQKNSVDTK